MGTAGNRSDLKMLDEEVDDIVTDEMCFDEREEKLDDLERRAAYKKKIQGAALKQLEKVKAEGAATVSRLRALIQRPECAECKELFERFVGDIEKMLDARRAVEE